MLPFFHRDSSEDTILTDVTDERRKLVAWPAKAAAASFSADYAHILSHYLLVRDYFLSFQVLENVSKVSGKSKNGLVTLMSGFSRCKWDTWRGDPFHSLSRRKSVHFLTWKNGQMFVNNNLWWPVCFVYLALFKDDYDVSKWPLKSFRLESVLLTSDITRLLYLLTIRKFPGNWNTH